MDNSTKYLVDKIEGRYNPENDCPTGQPLVTWTDITLLEIIKNQQQQIDSMVRVLRQLSDQHP